MKHTHTDMAHFKQVVLAVLAAILCAHATATITTTLPTFPDPPFGVVCSTDSAPETRKGFNQLFYVNPNEGFQSDIGTDETGDVQFSCKTEDGVKAQCERYSTIMDCFKSEYEMAFNDKDPFSHGNSVYFISCDHFPRILEKCFVQIGNCKATDAKTWIDTYLPTWIARAKQHVEYTGGDAAFLDTCTVSLNEIKTSSASAQKTNGLLLGAGVVFSMLYTIPSFSYPTQ